MVIFEPDDQDIRQKSAGRGRHYPTFVGIWRTRGSRVNVVQSSPSGAESHGDVFPIHFFRLVDAAPANDGGDLGRGSGLAASGRAEMTEFFDRSTDDAADLIVAIANDGDTDAFARLFAKFAPLIAGYLRRSGVSDGDAQEIAQETMLTVWRKARQFDPLRGPAASWMFTIARNRRLDRLRRRTTGDADIAAYYMLLADDGAPDGDAVRRLQVAVSKLPPEQIEVIRAAYFDHAAHGAISEKLGLPLGTVKSRLRLALKKLRAELDAPQ